MVLHRIASYPIACVPCSASKTVVQVRDRSGTRRPWGRHSPSPLRKPLLSRSSPLDNDPQAQTSWAPPADSESNDSASSNPSSSSVSVATTSSQPHVECVATGLGDVKCYIEDDGVETDRASPTATPSSTSLQSPEGPPSSSSSTSSTPLAKLLSVALLVSPFFFWGTSMVAMKGVTPHVTPLLMGSMRLTPAGLVLIAWAAASGRPQPKTALAWAWVLAFALVDGAAFQGFLAEGLQRTGAGLGSVIIDSQPLTVAVLAALLFGERLTPLAVLGLFVGVAGLLLLEVPQEVLSDGPAGLAALLQHLPSSGGQGGGGSLLDNGEFWMLLAAQSMALGTVMVRWVTKHCDPVMATGWHMVLGGLLLGAAAVGLDGSELTTRLSGFTPSDALAMTYVTLLGGAASYGIFFYEATHGSLTALSSLTFLTPMFAAGAGFLMLGETLTPVQLLGAGITLTAVFMINEKPGKEDGDSGSSSSNGSSNGKAV